MADTITVRCEPRGHTFTVEGLEALPPSAHATSDEAVYEVTDKIDCPQCTPPAEFPDL